MNSAAVPAQAAWTCFHCSETFTTVADARLHFGNSPMYRTACQIDEGLLVALRGAQDFADLMYNRGNRDTRDAERWRHARKFLSIHDIEGWIFESHHRPDEAENAKADAAIDAAMKRTE